MAIRALALRLTQQLLAKSNRLRRNLDQLIGLDIFQSSFKRNRPRSLEHHRRFLG